MTRAPLAILAVLTTSCVSSPDHYPIPEQHREFRAEPLMYSEFVDAADTDADRFFVRDIKPSDGGPWRWTHEEPELKFVISSEAADRQLVVEFTINGDTFKDTGPVAISFYVNDQLIAQERYTSPGDKKFQHSVSAAILKPGKENRVRMHVHDAWQTPYRGIRYGVLFRRAGFLPI
jgi:hypothetical protein